MNLILKRIEQIFLGHSRDSGSRPVSGRSGRSNDADVHSRVQSLLIDHDEVQAGDLHVVPLSDIARRKLGQDQAGTARVKRVAREVLNAHLSAADTYVIDRTGRVTVLMPGVRHDVGERRLSAIADAVLARLREGQASKPAVNVQTAVTTHHRPPATSSPADAERKLAAPSLREAAPPTARAGDRRDAWPSAARMRDVIRDEGWALRGRTMTTSADPIWRTSVGYITAYATRPVALGANGARRLAAEDLHHLPDRERVDVDAHILAEAVDRIDGAHCRAAGGLQVAPIALRSLERDPYRDRLFALLNEFNERERHLLVGELVDVPQPAPARRVAETCGRLATRCRGVWCRLPVTTADFAWLRGSGVAGVGTDLTGTDKPERDLLRCLETFAEAADRQGLACYVLGLPSVALTSAAIASGFAYVGGAALDRTHSDESGVAAFGLDDLYRGGRRAEPDHDG